MICSLLFWGLMLKIIIYKNALIIVPAKKFNSMSFLEQVKKDHRVSDAWNEGEDGYWVLLKNGYCDPLTECHAVHEWTIKDLKVAFKSIKPCTCVDCRRALAKNP